MREYVNILIEGVSVDSYTLLFLINIFYSAWFWWLNNDHLTKYSSWTPIGSWITKTSCSTGRHASPRTCLSSSSTRNKRRWIELSSLNILILNACQTEKEQLIYYFQSSRAESQPCKLTSNLLVVRAVMPIFIAIMKWMISFAVNQLWSLKYCEVSIIISNVFWRLYTQSNYRIPYFAFSFRQHHRRPSWDENETKQRLLHQQQWRESRR